MKFAPLLLGVLSLALASCAPPPPATPTKTVVVTYSVLGSLVRELVGDQFSVVVPLPNGMDIHEWEPSAKDIANLNRASLIVRNGLGLEEGMEGGLSQAAAGGVPVFTASDHFAVRRVKEGQGVPTGDADQAVGAADPHVWLDPLRLRSVVLALAAELKTRFGTDLDAGAADLAGRLEALDTEIRASVDRIPRERRLLVTGHESMGYFADAFGFTLLGAIVPSMTSQAEVSARDMADLKSLLRGRPVGVLFTEAGTPPKVAEALGSELHVKVVPLVTHALGPDGSYFTFLKVLAGTLVSAILEE